MRDWPGAVTIGHLLGLVSELNSEAFEAYQGDSMDDLPGGLSYPFEIASNGDVVLIKFLGIPVWDSDDNRMDDDRSMDDVRAYLHKNVSLISEYASACAKASMPDKPKLTLDDMFNIEAQSPPLIGK